MVFPLPPFPYSSVDNFLFRYDLCPSSPQRSVPPAVSPPRRLAPSNSPLRKFPQAYRRVFPLRFLGVLESPRGSSQQYPESKHFSLSGVLSEPFLFFFSSLYTLPTLFHYSPSPHPQERGIFKMNNPKPSTGPPRRWGAFPPLSFFSLGSLLSFSTWIVLFFPGRVLSVLHAL